LPLKDPLVAITMIAGKRHLTWDRSSRPDMPGIVRSDMRISGLSWRIAFNAEFPSSAERTEYPNSVSTSEIDVRILCWSSTTRTLLPM